MPICESLNPAARSASTASVAALRLVKTATTVPDFLVRAMPELLLVVNCRVARAVEPALSGHPLRSARAVGGEEGKRHAGSVAGRCSRVGVGEKNRGPGRGRCRWRPGPG